MSQLALALPGFEPSVAVAPTSVRLPWTKRAYQLECAANVFRNLATHRSTLCVMATGTGKTRTAGAGIIARWLDERRGRILWLAHLDTLIEQTRIELQAQLGEYVAREQGPSRWEGERVCVGSVATLYRQSRLNSIAHRPTLVIYDEAHHSVSSANRKIIDACKNAKIVGLTATPGRFDGVGLKAVYESVSIEYGIDKAIPDGYLVPILMDVAEIKGMDFSHLSKRDFSDENIGKVVGRDEVLRGIIGEVLKRTDTRRTAIFWPTVAVAHLAADVLNELRPGSAIAIDGTKMDKEEKKTRIRDFKSARYQFVCNVGVLAEGYDDPGISCVVDAAPTESASTYLQRMGRGTRNVCKVDDYETAEERRAAIATSTKPNLLVVDVTGNSGKHSPVSALDVLAGSDVDDETVERAKKIAKETRSTPEGAIAKAKSQIAREREEEARRVASAKAVRIDWRRVDPFAAFGLKPINSAVTSALDRVSIDQIRRLREAGIDNVDHLSGAEARKLIGTVELRKRIGLATFKQIRTLGRVGINGQQMYSAMASALIDRMKKDAVAAGRHEWSIVNPGESVVSEIIQSTKRRKNVG